MLVESVDILVGSVDTLVESVDMLVESVDILVGYVDTLVESVDKLPGAADLLAWRAAVVSFLRGHTFSTWGMAEFSSFHRNYRGRSCCGQCMYTGIQ